MKKVISLMSGILLLTTVALPWLSYAQQTQQDVVDWMYENEYTIYNTIDQYGWNQQVTRGQVSKFMLRFAEWQGKAKVKTPDECQFNDLEWYDYTLVPTIIAACEYGIVKWFNWNYMPNNAVTEAEIVTMLVRILMGNHDETTSPRWYWYDNVAVWSGIYSRNDRSVWDLDTPALRGTVATWLYRGALVDTDTLQQEWSDELKDILEEIFGEGVL